MSVDINDTLGFAVNSAILLGTFGLVKDVVDETTGKKKKRSKKKNTLDGFDPIGEFKF